MINPRARRRGRGLRHVHIKIRLTKVGAKPTHEEVLEVVDYIIDNGDAPEGWNYYGTDWTPQNIGEQGIANILQAWRDSLDVGVVQIEGSGSGVASYVPLTLNEMRDRIADSGFFSRREVKAMKYWGTEKLLTTLALVGSIYEYESEAEWEWEIEIVAEVDT